MSALLELLNRFNKSLIKFVQISVTTNIVKFVPQQSIKTELKTDMTFKLLSALAMLTLVSACQNTVSLDQMSNKGPTSPAIAVIRPQDANDFPVAYLASTNDAQQRAKFVNRLELVEPQPKGWFEKFKNMIGF